MEGSTRGQDLGEWRGLREGKICVESLAFTLSVSNTAGGHPLAVGCAAVRDASRA